MRFVATGRYLVSQKEKEKPIHWRGGDFAGITRCNERLCGSSLKNCLTEAKDGLKFYVCRKKESFQQQ